MTLHESVSQEWNWKKFLNVVSWLQMMLMDHTNHTEKSVWNSDPRSTRYSRCSAAMPFSQNLNFSDFVPSNGCGSFNFWARIMKFWILKVLKSYPKHSFIKIFDLLSEKLSYLVYRVERSSDEESHIFSPTDPDMTLEPWRGEKAWPNAFLKAISWGHFFDLLDLQPKTLVFFTFSI